MVKVNANGQRMLFVASLAMAILFGCAQSSSSDEDNDKGKTSTKKPAATTAPTSDATKDTAPTDGSSVSCWEKLLNKAEADKCTGIYTHSSKACVSANLTKEASCTRALIAAKYSTAKLSGIPVMDTVDTWIKDGYEPTGCANGNDSKLYVYFLKKVFTAKTATDASDHYAIAEKKLGPGGAILDSIVLQTTTTPSEFVCE